MQFMNGLKLLRNKKIIIWGHPLHSHTHSYIHYSFYRAFKYLNFDTYWMSSIADVGNMDLTDSIFIVEGQVDGNIPLRRDCKYLLHNCDITKYVEANVFFRILQVYSHDVLERDCEKIQGCEYYQDSLKTLYQPWATDLLPHEFDNYSPINNFKAKSKVINWVGSVMQGEHGNQPCLEEFAGIASLNGIEFKIYRNVEPDESIKLIRDSYMSPALQGKWQVENGYIPCRIFKNISYGHLGSTNSRAVYDLYEGQLIYSNSPAQLFVELDRQIKNFDKNTRDKIRLLTKERHTYVNRIQNILKIME